MKLTIGPNDKSKYITGTKQFVIRKTSMYINAKRIFHKANILLRCSWILPWASLERWPTSLIELGLLQAITFKSACWNQVMSVYIREFVVFARIHTSSGIRSKQMTYLLPPRKLFFCTHNVQQQRVMYLFQRYPLRITCMHTCSMWQVVMCPCVHGIVINKSSNK